MCWQFKSAKLQLSPFWEFYSEEKSYYAKHEFVDSNSQWKLRGELLRDLTQVTNSDSSEERKPNFRNSGNCKLLRKFAASKIQLSHVANRFLSRIFKTLAQIRFTGSSRVRKSNFRKFGNFIMSVSTFAGL